MSIRIDSAGLTDARVEPLTILDLVAAVSEITSNNAEVVAVVDGLLREGRVRVGRPFDLALR